MSKNISKELVGEVTDSIAPIKELGKWNKFDNSIYIFYENQAGKTINIYELAHKCKEKAYKKGFIILSGYHENNINAFQVKCFGWTSDKIHIKFNLEVEDTEPIAVFKAYQWILDKEKTEQC